MAYTFVNGTNGNNFLAFVGVTGFYSHTFINPYSGQVITISGIKNVNNGIYDGLNGNDTLNMTSLGDVLTLTDGVGTIMVKNVEQFNAGDDGDVIVLADANVNYGNTTIRGSNGNDLLWANNGNDALTGGNGDDIMDGGGGDDLLAGGLDDDYLSGGLGMDTLLGGEGNDTLVYSIDGIWSGGYTLASMGSSVPYAYLVQLDGKNRTHDTYNGDAADDFTVPTAGSDTLVLTAGDDALILSDLISPLSTIISPRIAYIETIEAGAGNDVIDLSGDTYIDVTINGDSGNDLLSSSTGNDTLNGGADDDMLYGATGNDTLNGGTGDDTYLFNSGDNDDVIVETSGVDIIAFGAGLSFADVTLEVSGLDLIVYYDSASITIVNHFAADGSGRVEGFAFFDGSMEVINIAPDAQDDHFAAVEDTDLSGNVLDNDSDAENLTLTVVAGVFGTSMGGTVELLGDGIFTYTPPVNFYGDDSFDYSIVDSYGATDTATVSLCVVSVNDDPVAHDDYFGGDEDNVITGHVLGNDTDIEDSVPCAIAGVLATAMGGSVEVFADGFFVYTPAENFFGADSFEYTAIDEDGATDAATVTLEVASVNDDPVGNDDSASGDEDSVITGSVLDNDTDVDGDALHVYAETTTSVNGGTVTINADGTFSYQGAANFHGADSFEYKVKDGQGGFDYAEVTLNVGSVNDGPVANDDNTSGDEDSVIAGSVLGNDTDEDGDTLTVDAATFVTANGGAVVLNADGTFTYQGAANFHGNDSFSYIARDASGAMSTANVLVAVASVNDTPVANDDSFAGFRNDVITGAVLSNDSDVDGDTLSVSAGTFATANGGTIVLDTDGSFTYTPAHNYYGSDSFDYTLLDGAGGSDVGSLYFDVALNPDDSIIGTEDGEVIIGTNGNDEIFGLGGDDTLYGDDGILTGTTIDKAFADTIVMPTLKEGVNITNLRPKGDPALGINNGNLHIDHDASAQITFRKGYAGYDNSFGVFAIAGDGTIVNASMEWKNVKTAGLDVAHTVDLPVGAEGGDFGFFIVSNGNNTNGGYSGLNVTADGVLSFVYNYGQAGQRAATVNDPGNKVSLVYNDGVTVKVLQGDVYFTTDRGDSTAINEDGKMHVVSGLMDNNNQYLDIKNTDVSGKPTAITKNGFTISASTGYLCNSNTKLGINSSSAGGAQVGGAEIMTVALAAGATKITVSLSDITGGNTGIDFKIYLNGSTTPVSYEHVVGTVTGGLLDIVLDAANFGGGIITKFEISSVSNSTKGVETFWIDNLYAEIPGGTDTNTLRIGFEDLYNTGDADYEDVLFDVDVNPVTIGDIHGGNDILDGGLGNDVLYGEGGNDILVIGLGGDHAYGGAGDDVFAITAIDGALDTIHDFGVGDSINIHDVLDSYDTLSDDIADFVRLVSVGSDMRLEINADGQGSDFAAAALIVGGTGGADIAAMIANGQLVADQSAIA